jgi:hypothetical protein
MDCTIYNCHHAAPDYSFKQPMFMSLVSGIPAPNDQSYLSDLDGENIASRLEHSEMRQQFYVWRNLAQGQSYVGFEHYRRLFFLDPLSDDQVRERYPAVYEARFSLLGDSHVPRLVLPRAAFDEYLTMRRNLGFAGTGQLRSWIGAHDVIVQRPLFHMALDAQWQSTHMADLWDTLVEAAVQSPYFRHHRMQIDFTMKTPHYCNMYIMRSDLFDEYMHFWWDAVNFITTKIAVYPRLVGHFAERLFNFFLFQKRMEYPLLRVSELPHLFLDEQAPPAGMLAA